MAGALTRRASSARIAQEISVDSQDETSLKEDSHQESWLFAFLQRHSLILNNRGSVARDHLANERTYLAWTRTALVMMTLGLAFLQLYSIQARAQEVVYKGERYELDSERRLRSIRLIGKPFGILVGIFSLATVGIGFYRYLAVQSALRKGEFPATRYLVVMLLLMSLVLMTLILTLDIKSL